MFVGVAEFGVGLSDINFNLTTVITLEEFRDQMHGKTNAFDEKFRLHHGHITRKALDQDEIAILFFAILYRKNVRYMIKKNWYNAIITFFFKKIDTY